jgi:hypothetical protein
MNTPQMPVFQLICVIVSCLCFILGSWTGRWWGPATPTPYHRFWVSLGLLFFVFGIYLLPQMIRN